MSRPRAASGAASEPARVSASDASASAAARVPAPGPTLQPRKKGGSVVCTQTSTSPLCESCAGGVTHDAREADLAHGVFLVSRT